MINIIANTGTQIRVEFDGEVFNRVPVRGSVHLRVKGDVVELWGNPWETSLYRADKFLEHPTTKTRDAAIARAIAVGTEWVAKNKETLLEAARDRAAQDLERCREAAVEARVAYEQATGAFERALNTFTDAERKYKLAVASRP